MLLHRGRYSARGDYSAVGGYSIIYGSQLIKESINYSKGMTKVHTNTLQIFKVFFIFFSI